MLEKEAYGKLKKMCNTLDDIRILLLIVAESNMLSTTIIKNKFAPEDKEADASFDYFAGCAMESIQTIAKKAEKNKRKESKEGGA